MRILFHDQTNNSTGGRDSFDAIIPTEQNFTTISENWISMLCKCLILASMTFLEWSITSKNVVTSVTFLIRPVQNKVTCRL